MMICTQYCDFNETLSSHVSKDSGLPRCIMGTVPPAVLLLLVFLLALIQLYKKRKIQTDRQGRTLLSDLESTSIQEIRREENKPCNCVLKCKRVDGICEMKESSIQFIANPAEFVHGDNCTSFLYTFQQLLHICLVFVPIIDIITKAAMEPNRLQGYVVFSDGGMLLTWMLAFFVLRTESTRYFKVHMTRHSFGLLLFWSLAFVMENLAFISWNNPHWWFGRKTRNQEAEFGLFITRYVIIVVIFLLGLKGPGLYQPQPVPVKEEPKFLEGSAVSQLYYFILEQQNHRALYFHNFIDQEMYIYRKSHSLCYIIFTMPALFTSVINEVCFTCSNRK